MAQLLLPAPLFAHQFGWDEILMFAVPIVLAVVGVRYAESRAAKRQAAQQAADGVATDEPATPAGSVGDDSTGSAD
jgi:hypothetical protein